MVQFVFEQGADPDPLGAEGEQDKAAGTEREGRVTAAGSEDVLKLPVCRDAYEGGTIQTEIPASDN